MCMVSSFKVNGQSRNTRTGLLILIMCSGLDYVFVFLFNSLVAVVFVHYTEPKARAYM